MRETRTLRVRLMKRILSTGHHELQWG